MKKQLIIGGALAVVGGLGITMATPVSATKYQPNMDTLESQFVITSVQPSTSTIKVRYNGLPDNHRALSMINVQGINVEKGATEDRLDEMLPGLGQTMPVLGYLIYYEETYALHPTMDYGPEEKALTASRYQRAIDLDKETLHILYYSIRVGERQEKNYVYSKIDYSLCMKSVVYKPGVECRAENKPEGGVWYWPYYDGEKLKIPREEWEAWGYHEDEPQPEPTPTPIPTPEPTPVPTPNSTPTSVPQVAETDNTRRQKQQDGGMLPPQVAVTKQEIVEGTQQQPDLNMVPQAIRDTIEVPVSGDTCHAQTFPWWLVILSVILLGAEGGILYWWFIRKRKN